MNITLIVSYLVFSLMVVTNTERVSYKGYQIYIVDVKDEKQTSKLLNIQKQNTNIHILSQISPEELYGSFSITVSPEFKDDFEEFLKDNHFHFWITNKDLERLIQLEQARVKRSTTFTGEINFREYHRHAEINSYLKLMAKRHPNIATTIDIGKTTENRDLLGIKVSKNQKPKPMILIDAGIHAREWIAPAFALYIIQQLIENVELIENVDWIIIPSMNPDGYEYTHTTDRLWRKTRSKGKDCGGVDANRNFDFHWGEKGSEENECSDIYRGPKAFSEPETKAFAKLVLMYANNIKLAISLHSFSQLILYPWSYTTKLPSNSEELDYLGVQVAHTLKNSSGGTYTVGSASRILYYAAGSCSDWIMGVPGINLTYVIELPPAQDDSMQFIIPSIYINEIVSKMFEGIKVFHKYIENKYKGT